MLPHHAEVYKHLVAQFPDADVYIATSNKVEMPKSPFDAKEKSAIMTQLHDIPADKILIVRSPYNAREYETVFDMENTVAIFAVGGKDMEDDPRFSFKPKKDGSPSYLQKINTISDGEMPMTQRGYVYSAPTVSSGSEAASASAFRNSFANAPDIESAKKVFTDTFGKFDEKVFTLLYDKITGTNMSESLDILRKLAGISEAPVDFKPGKGKMDYEPKISRKDQADADSRPEKAASSNPDTATFTDIAPDAMISVDTGKPIKSKGRFNSMANMVPADKDPNDPEVKKELFIKLMAKSPSFLLGEINARLGTDDESLAASDRLSSIMKRVEGGSIMDLPEDDRQWTMKLIKNALLNMELHRADAGDQEEFGEPDPEENMPEESVDFSDIRNEYGIEEAGRGSKALMPGGKLIIGKGEVAFHDDYGWMARGWGDDDFEYFDSEQQARDYVEQEYKRRKEISKQVDNNPEESEWERRSRHLANEPRVSAPRFKDDEVEESMKDAAEDAEEDEIEEGAMKDCPCCDGGKGACSHGKEKCGTCNGTGKVPADFETEEFPMEDAVEETATNALDAALAELKSLAGL